MAPRLPQTKEEAIINIYNRILGSYLSNKTGLINPKDFQLLSAENQLNKFKSGLVASNEFASYYATLGLISAAKGNYKQALTYYKNVMNIASYDASYFANYITILLKNSLFQEVEDTLVEHFDKGGKDYDLISLLFLPALYSLDFTLFRKYYELIRGKDILPASEKEAIEFSYSIVEQFEQLKEDLNTIGIEKSVFSDFIKLLNSFHSVRLYDELSFRYSIENSDEQYLIVDIYADVSIDDALSLTNAIEGKLVDYALETNSADMLSKFLVYYKPIDLLKDDSETKFGIYLGMNEELKA